ncbi:MAG: transcription/translation regulatory transformer protein RfaH [Magnetovibrio sp.]|nr:transcription/translation regulatory transformer protein RfaH [Magnetovibrio sp.]
MMKHWYVARTKPNSEDRAQWHLRNQGFETYLPRYRKQIRHARKVQTVLRALFPGYIFVSIDTKHQNWASINGTVGVVSLVQFGDRPEPVSAGIIDAIRDGEEKGVVKVAPQGLKKGDRIVVREGVFAEHTALFEEECDEKRSFLLLDLMGRSVRVNVESEHLMAIS